MPSNTQFSTGDIVEWTDLDSHFISVQVRPGSLVFRPIRPGDKVQILSLCNKSNTHSKWGNILLTCGNYCRAHQIRRVDDLVSLLEGTI